MLLVFPVSGDGANLSAKKNQRCVLSVTLWQWDLKKKNGLDRSCVCVSMLVSGQPDQFSGGRCTFDCLHFAKVDSSAKIKDLPFFPEKMTHNAPEKEGAMHSGVCQVYKSVSA